MSTPLNRRIRAVGAAGVAAAVTAALLSLAGPAQAAPQAGLELVAVRHSQLATHYWYRQTYGGHEVLGGYYAKHVDTRTGAVAVQDGRRTVTGLDSPNAAVSKEKAVIAAWKGAGDTVQGTELVVLPGSTAKLAWSVRTGSDAGAARTLVDAGNGAVLRVDDLVKHETGTGQVFNPNAVVTLQNEGLTDQNNANYAAIKAAYKTVTLTNLNAGGKLRGTYAYNANPNGKQVTSSTRTFKYNRSQAGFEQTMAYFHLTEAQKYIHSIGFTDVNSEPQNFKTVGLTDDNSFYEPAKDQITYGTGGVDDAEDAEVIWHEYGHAIQDAQVPGFGSSEEGGAIGEGFGDYWAFTMSIPVSAATAKTPLACIADWDAVSYTSGTPHCLRRVDGTKVYPADADGEVHDDGEIWSRALFDIHGALGRTKANTVILEAQFSYAPDTSFAEAAQATVATAQTLYGAAAANSVQQAFHARGIL